MRIFFIYILFFPLFIFSQNAILETDTSYIRIGEQFNLNIKVYGVDDDSIMWPNNDSIFQQFELLNSSITSILSENDTHVVHNYLLTSFDTGQFTIPSFCIYKSLVDSLITKPLDIHVLSIPLDTTNQFFDIKPPKNIPLLARELLMYFFYVLLFLLLVICMVFLIKYLTRKKVPNVIDLKPAIPIDVYFLNALNDLEDKDYLKDDKYKDFYTELSEIFRGYLEMRFHIAALESSTYELKGLLSELKIKDKWLSSFFRNNDIVKFAKGIPSKKESHLFLESIKIFIQNFGVDSSDEKTDLNKDNKL